MTKEPDDALFDVRALAAKGEGKVIRHRSGVWTYPGCATDPTGTNVVYPTEYVREDRIRAALAGDAFVVAMMDVANEPVAIQLRLAGSPFVPMSMARAGTADAGTELPPNSIPTRDAGAVLDSAPEVERVATKSLTDLITPPVSAKKRGS